MSQPPHGWRVWWRRLVPRHVATYKVPPRSPIPPSPPFPPPPNHRRQSSHRFKTSDESSGVWLPFSSASWFAFSAASQTPASSPPSASPTSSLTLSTSSRFCGTASLRPICSVLLRLFLRWFTSPFYDLVLFACLAGPVVLGLYFHLLVIASDTVARLMDVLPLTYQDEVLYLCAWTGFFHLQPCPVVSLRRPVLVMATRLLALSR